MLPRYRSGKFIKQIRKIIIAFLVGIIISHYGGSGSPGQTFLPSPGNASVFVQPKPLWVHLPHHPNQKVFLQRLQDSHSAGLVTVVGAAGADQAHKIAQDLQTTWEKMAQLADRWTQHHRRACFPVGRLIVVVGQSRMHFPKAISYPKLAPARGTILGRPELEALIWHLDQQPATVLMATEPSSKDPQELLRELERQIVLVFLAHLPNGPQLPLWVRLGLAEYITGAEKGAAWPSRMPPWPPGDQEIAWGQAPPEHLEISPEAYRWYAQWIRYFLEGRDAEYAPAFLEALGAGTPRNQLENLVRQVARNSGAGGNWDPAYGQPVVRFASEPRELGEAERKLVFLLKLHWRFTGGEIRRSNQPRILEQGQDRSLQMAWSAEKPTPNSLKELQQRILDPHRRRWATLDWDGQLLFSEDQQRWEAFFQQLHSTYRITQLQQKGKTLWQLEAPEGGIIEGWMEENLSHPGRPFVFLRRIRS